MLALAFRVILGQLVIMQKLITLFILTISSVVSFGQINHFPDHKWKEKQTEHFAIRTLSTSPKLAEKYVEKVWKVCERVLPGIKEEYANNTFKTVKGDKASDTAPYRFTVYLVGRKYPFKDMVDKMASQLDEGKAEGFKKICMETLMITDADNRYVVLCLDGRTGPTEAVLVHSVASAMLAGHCRISGDSGFFYTAGFGYYMEHMIFKKCRVYYLDFSEYYKDVKIIRGTTLDSDSPWPKPIQKMVKKDVVKPRIMELFGTTVNQLNPPRSGMIFALAHFFCNDPENVKMHHALVNKLRDGKEFSVELILESYGKGSEKEFNTAVEEYILTRKFR